MLSLHLFFGRERVVGMLDRADNNFVSVNSQN